MTNKMFTYSFLGVFALILGCATENNRVDTPLSSLAKGMSPDSGVTAAVSNPSADDENNYRIEPNDVLDIDFYLNPEFNDEQVVRPDGKISLRLVGEAQAKGRTPGELAQDLDEAYS